MKKIIFLFAICLPIFGFGQKYVLIDKGWHRPVMVVDTVTKDQLQNGWFPVYANEIDSLKTLIGSFKTLFDKGMNRAYINNEEYKTENIQFDITNIQKANGDRYNIVIISKIPNATVKFRLSNPDYSNRINQQRIKLFLIYLNKFNS